MSFLKPHIDKPGLLNANPGDPEGYVSKDGMWAAIPFANKKDGFAIIHNGSHVHKCKTYKQAMTYITKEQKKLKKRK